MLFSFSGDHKKKIQREPVCYFQSKNGQNTGKIAINSMTIHLECTTSSHFILQSLFHHHSLTKPLLEADVWNFHCPSV